MSYQWLRNGAPFGEPTPTPVPYDLVGADVLQGAGLAGTNSPISIRVTATLAGYTTKSATSALVVDHTIDFPVTAVTIGTGDLGVGVGLPLMADTSAWTAPGSTAAPKFTYKWFREAAAISGATKATYTPSSKDVGHTISVQVTGSAFGYTNRTTLAGDVAGVVIPSYIATAPKLKISGTAVVGQTLAFATSGSWGPAAAIVGMSTEQQWFRNGVAIPDATDATYQLVAADGGQKITVRLDAVAARQRQAPGDERRGRSAEDLRRGDDDDRRDRPWQPGRDRGRGRPHRDDRELGGGRAVEVRLPVVQERREDLRRDEVDLYDPVDREEHRPHGRRHGIAHRLQDARPAGLGAEARPRLRVLRAVVQGERLGGAGARRERRDREGQMGARRPRPSLHLVRGRRAHRGRRRPAHL